MCGIGGIVRWGKEPILEETIACLLAGNDHRGNDASGLVIQQVDGSLNILKKDVPAWKLAALDEYDEFIEKYLKPDSTSVLVHARGASQGNPRIYENNHPMHAGKSAIIHNGSIKNDDTLFSSMKLDRKARTDSDIIRAIVDANGLTEKAIKELARMSGSGAIAGVHPEYPGKLLLLRSGNPLTTASNDNFFYFASEKNTLHKACRSFVQRGGMWFQAQRPNVDFGLVADHTAWVIGPRGVEVHKECRICTGQYIEPWRKTYEEYETRQEKWNRQMLEAKQTKYVEYTVQDGRKMKPAYCLDCKKEWLIPIAGDYKGFQCNKKKGGCGKPLVAPIVAAASAVTIH